MPDNVTTVPVLLAPIGLIILYGLTVPLLIFGRRAILMGNWYRHRNFMLVSCVVFAMTMSLTLEHIVLMIMYGASGAGLLLTVSLGLLALHLALAMVLIVMIPWTLYRVARHLLLPHKLMARRTIKVWFATAGTGVLYSAVVILSHLTG